MALKHLFSHDMLRYNYDIHIQNDWANLKVILVEKVTSSDYLIL